ncbi:MAG: histidine kinase dimerization/phospho-acceptor domain-containing protein, partial [Pseudomonadota bacterium]
YYRDNNGVFAGCNKMFEEVMGKSSSELIGKTVEQIFPNDFLSEVLRTDKEVEQTHKALTIDVGYEVDGATRWFELRKLPFINDEGDYIGLLGFGRDITSRKEAAEALETAYKDKGKFIATLSHELRTPLNGIFGTIELLRKTKLTDRQTGYLDVAQRSGDFLLHHVNDVLDVTRLEAGEMVLSSDEIDLEIFFHDVIATNKPTALARGNELSLSLPKNPMPNVLGDEQRLR